MKYNNVEIILTKKSTIPQASIKAVVKHYLENNENFKNETVIRNFDGILHPILFSEVFALILNETKNFESDENSTVKWQIYKLDSSGPLAQIEDDEHEDEINIATHLVLPSESLYNLWENLYYENDIKENLLKYAQTMMEFSDKGVDNNIVSCNRVILLHGPPGTGKTSLCKALAQKLVVRMQDRYSSGTLIEINSHSLFSKWFSESGKLVNLMFSKINQVLENPNVFVCVLIDEIESLARARNQCISGNEPSDAVRVVNAVLTQIDQIKRFPNVLILTTSNIAESIDLAFVDRADIKQYLGLPSKPAIYKVYHSCLEELMKSQIISTENTLTFPLIECKKEDENGATRKLHELCEKSQGLSGRSLRKIPFLAHALFLQKAFVTFEEFLKAMVKAVEWEQEERNHFEIKSK